MLVAILLYRDHFVISPVFVRKFGRRPIEGTPVEYSNFICVLWLLTALSLFLWIYEGRDWNAIALSVPDRMARMGAPPGASAVVIIREYKRARASKGREKC